MRQLANFQVTSANNVIFYPENVVNNQEQYDTVNTFSAWDTPIDKIRVKYASFREPVLIHKKARDKLRDEFGISTIGDLILNSEVNFSAVRDAARSEHCSSFTDHFATFVACMKNIPTYDSKGYNKLISIPVNTRFLVVNSEEVEGVSSDDIKEISKAIDCYLKEKTVDIVRQGTKLQKRKKLDETRAKLALLEDQMRELEESIAGDIS